MLEKFFDLNRVLITFIITSLILVIFVFIFSKIDPFMKDVTIYIIAGILFFFIKLMFAIYDMNKNK